MENLRTLGQSHREKMALRDCDRNNLDFCLLLVDDAHHLKTTPFKDLNV